MATDVFIKVLDTHISASKIDTDVNQCIEYLKSFQDKFSRFIEGNELSSFNNSGGNIKVSDELFEMLQLSIYYNQKTNGCFDISILNDLKNEGYVTSKNNGFIDDSTYQKTKNSAFENLKIVDEKSHIVNKPKDLKVDLGGIGKSYAIKHIADFLLKQYTNFIIDIGGDIYVHGCNVEEGYDYWAIGIENPKDKNQELVTLCLKNAAVATSGINRRNWISNGVKKNHIINPFLHVSVGEELLTASVASANIIEADVVAKSLLIMGLKQASKYVSDNKTASVLIDSQLKIYISDKMEQYVWKA